MDIAPRYRATLLERTADGTPATSRCFHPARGDGLTGAVRNAVGALAGHDRYTAGSTRRSWCRRAFQSRKG